MGQKAMRLIPPILLVLLASGSWAQNTEFLQKLEGDTIMVRCQYKTHQRSKVKSLCRKMSANYCTVLEGGHRTKSRVSIQDHRESDYFHVTMTELRVKDSGVYYCGIFENSHIYILRIIQLEVSKASTRPTTRTIGMTTALALATSPVIGSPPGNQKWTFISSGVVVAILLLGLIVLIVLYLRKAQGRDKKGEKESHHICEDLSDQKEKKAPGFYQQIISDDTGAIYYASLIHLNHLGPEDSIYVNTHPNSNLKPMPDPLWTVEYASITGKRLSPSTMAARDGEPRN